MRPVPPPERRGRRGRGCDPPARKVGDTFCGRGCPDNGGCAPAAALRPAGRRSCRRPPPRRTALRIHSIAESAAAFPLFCLDLWIPKLWMSYQVSDCFQHDFFPGESLANLENRAGYLCVLSVLLFNGDRLVLAGVRIVEVAGRPDRQVVVSDQARQHGGVNFRIGRAVICGNVVAGRHDEDASTWRLQQALPPRLSGGRASQTYDLGLPT